MGRNRYEKAADPMGTAAVFFQPGTGKARAFGRRYGAASR
jgi:hypothetical protein